MQSSTSTRMRLLTWLSSNLIWQAAFWSRAWIEVETLPKGPDRQGCGGPNSTTRRDIQRGHRTIDNSRPCGYVAIFPLKRRFASSCNKAIRRINPEISDDLDELAISAPFNTFRGLPFVLHQEAIPVNGRNEIILVLGTEQFLEARLTRSPVVGMDGTFKVVPHPVYDSLHMA